MSRFDEFGVTKYLLTLCPESADFDGKALPGW